MNILFTSVMSLKLRLVRSITYKSFVYIIVMILEYKVHDNNDNNAGEESRSPWMITQLCCYFTLELGTGNSETGLCYYARR